MRVRFDLFCGFSLLLLSTPALRGQVLITEAEWRAAIKDVAKSSHQIKSLEAQLHDVTARGEQLEREEESLDSNPCSSSGSSRNDCTAYNNEEQALEQNKQALLLEWQADEQELRSIEDHVTGQLGRIRSSKILAGHEVWTQRVKKCAALPPIDAVACLDTVKED